MNPRVFDRRKGSQYLTALVQLTHRLRPVERRFQYGFYLWALVLCVEQVFSGVMARAAQGFGNGYGVDAQTVARSFVRDEAGNQLASFSGIRIEGATAMGMLSRNLGPSERYKSFDYMTRKYIPRYAAATPSPIDQPSAVPVLIDPALFGLRCFFVSVDATLGNLDDEAVGVDNLVPIAIPVHVGVSPVVDGVSRLAGRVGSAFSNVEADSVRGVDVQVDVALLHDLRYTKNHVIYRHIS